MVSEFQIKQHLEWCVDLPVLDHARESAAFVFKGNEWLFRLVLEKESQPEFYFKVYLMLKNKNTDITPFNVKLNAGFKYEQSLTLWNGSSTTISRPVVIWRMEQSYVLRKLPPNYFIGNWLKFQFYFDDISENLMKLSKETGDKFVQTPSYMDTNFLLEGASKDLSALLDEGPNYDVELICENEIVKAHKNVLSCRSEVFASMLRTDMIEGKTGQIKIQDMDGAIFKEFIKSLYTGVLDNLTVETALQFYEVSDKYAVDALKAQCASFLLENLSTENFCDVLIVADRHNDTDFKEKVVEQMIKSKIPHIGEK